MGYTVLLTGRPGVGKTTIVKEIVRRLPGRANGFYTAEIRHGGRRQGFRIITLDGEEAILAHVDIRSPHRVSKYGVDVEALDSVGVAALRRAMDQADYVVIDEIGKMELCSNQFKQAVREAIAGEHPVLGTIMLSSHPWADAIKANEQVRVIDVTPKNRDRLVEQVLRLFKDV
ncbi:MAG: NTPase [Anaerolineae bacterium]